MMEVSQIPKVITGADGGAWIVDDDKFNMLNEYEWHSHENGYAVTFGNGTVKSMHRLLIDCPDGLQVDHKNNMPNDNRIENLRICTRSQNEANKRKMKGKSTEYKGVTDRDGSYEVSIRNPNNNSKKTYIGRYTNIIAASNVYNHFAEKFYGEFAKLNKVPFMSMEECSVFQNEKENTSQYRGVSWNNKHSAWRVSIRINGKDKHLGLFTCEKSAANAYNKYAIEQFGEETLLNKVEFIDEKDWIYTEKKMKEKSKYLGVSPRKNGKKWRARVYVKGEEVWIGDFETEIEAAKARDKFIIDNDLKRKLNFT